jgi:hypothetical protein
MSLARIGQSLNLPNRMLREHRFSGVVSVNSPICGSISPRMLREDHSRDLVSIPSDGFFQ